MKTKNLDVKLLFTIGGWTEFSPLFSKIAADANATLNFAKSIVAYMTKYNFDGIDIDWEFPAKNGGVAADKV